MDREIIKKNILKFDKDEIDFRINRRMSIFKGLELIIPTTAHRYFTHLSNCYTYGFYFACIPFAGMCLEFVLKEFIIKLGGVVDEEHDTLGTAIKKAKKVGIIKEEGWDKIEKVLVIRNKYVHVKKTKFETVIYDGKLERNKEIRVAPPDASADAFEIIKLISEILSKHLDDKTK